MNQEVLKPWRPIEGLGNKVHIYSVCNDYESFRVVLVEHGNTTRRLLLDFRGSVRAYRETDDLVALHLLRGHVEPFENEEPHPWALYTVTNSEYLKWASHNSGIDPITILGIVHYAICTEDAVLEILSWCEPKVVFVNIE